MKSIAMTQPTNEEIAELTRTALRIGGHEPIPAEQAATQSVQAIAATIGERGTYVGVVATTGGKTIVRTYRIGGDEDGEAAKRAGDTAQRMANPTQGPSWIENGRTG